MSAMHSIWPAGQPKPKLPDLTPDQELRADEILDFSPSDWHAPDTYFDLLESAGLYPHE